MATITGGLLYLEFKSVVLSGKYRSFGATETGGLVDASAGADANRTYLTTLKDGTATGSILIETAVGTLKWIAVAPLGTGTLRWGEQGSHQGSLNHSVTAFVTERRKTMAYADLVVADVTWQFSGAVTDSTFPA